jgi:hypothetical protein
MLEHDIECAMPFERSNTDVVRLCKRILYHRILRTAKHKSGARNVFMRLMKELLTEKDFSAEGVSNHQSDTRSRNQEINRCAAHRSP